LKHKSFAGAPCSIARSLGQVGEWWSLLIVRDVLGGARRFGELLESLGVARNVLSARLKALVGDGILELRPARDGSPYQEYALTEKGRDLTVPLVALKQWGDRWTVPDTEFPLVLVERATGEEIGSVEVRSRDGRSLAPEEITFAPRGKAAP